jgi:DNA (cytosine-5)-methyltransferase 1
MMKHLGLFEGIGGFSLAAHWAGWETLAWCEWNEFGQKVLRHHFPEAEGFGDIKKTEFTKYANRIDVLTGGFPCQPFSLAGKRKGTEDERHLWPEMLRAIREIQPTWVVGENVFGIVNWDGGMVFNQVQSDLEAEGYEVQPYVLPACAVNAPHRRDRVWFVAYSNKCTKRPSRTSGGVVKQGSNNNDEPKEWREQTEQYIGCSDVLQNVAHSDCNGFNGGNSKHEINTSEGGEYAQRNVEQMGGDAIHSQQQGLERANWLFESERLKQGCKEYDATNAISIGQPGKEYREKERRRITETGVPNDWQDFPTQPPVCGIYDGISEWILRNIKSEIYATISKRYTDKDLQEMWKAIQSQEIQEQIRGLYKIHEKGVLFQTMQLCSPSNRIEKGFSVWSEKASKDIMRKLSKYGTITNSPQGRELEKQFTEQFADTLPYLSHEVALVAMETEKAAAKFKSWHRNESIKAYGNAIVPAVAFQIFKAINEHTKHTDN